MRRTAGLIGGAALAVTLSQFPEFAQQYEQRLGGAVDQLRAVIADFDASAERSGLTRQEALATYDQSGEPFLADRSRDMQATFVRYEKLDAHLKALEEAGPVEKITDFARYYDPEIGSRALAAFQWAVPIGVEGFAWAGAGLAAGYLGITGLIAGAGRLRRRGRAQSAAGQSDRH